MAGKSTKKTSPKKAPQVAKKTSTKASTKKAAPESKKAAAKKTAPVTKTTSSKKTVKKARAKGPSMTKAPAKSTSTKGASTKKARTMSVATLRAATKKAPTKGTRRKPNPTSSDALSASRKIDEKIASLEDWRGERLAQIRKLIHDVDPDVVEEFKWMGTPVWSHDGMFANANPFKDKVKITFHHGAELRDPGKLFNNGFGGGKWRAIDLREEDALDPTKFKALLREAIAYNRSHNVPKSKGSRASLLK